VNTCADWIIQDRVPIGFVETGSAPHSLTPKQPSPSGGTVNYVETKKGFFGEINLDVMTSDGNVMISEEELFTSPFVTPKPTQMTPVEASDILKADFMTTALLAKSELLMHWVVTVLTNLSRSRRRTWTRYRLMVR
jgi:hypothetical protein